MRFVVVFACEGNCVMRTGRVDEATAIATASRIRGKGRFACIAPATRFMRDAWPEIAMTTPFLAALGQTADPKRADAFGALRMNGIN